MDNPRSPGDFASPNPYERYDLDPREGIAAITARLKELAEDATDPAERERIRAAWEELTLHPARRHRAALFAHPETRPPLGNPPPLLRRRPAARPDEGALPLAQIAPAASLLVALGEELGADPTSEPLDADAILRPRVRAGP